LCENTHKVNWVTSGVAGSTLAAEIAGNLDASYRVVAFDYVVDSPPARGASVLRCFLEDRRKSRREVQIVACVLGRPKTADRALNPDMGGASP